MISKPFVIRMLVYSFPCIASPSSKIRLFPPSLVLFAKMKSSKKLGMSVVLVYAMYWVIVLM